MCSGFCFFWIWVRENSPNSTSECVYFLIFDVFFEKNEFGDFEPEFGENLQTQKNMRAKVFFDTKNTLCTHILLPKNFCTHIFFWVWRFSPNSGSKSPNSFFSKKNRKLKNTHTQRLSLENSPNSRVEFGDFPELRFKRNKIPKTCFFSKTKMSLENSPNSSAEFGEFSKLIFKRIFSWVWRTLQTQELSLENSPNSRVEFGDFSKLKFKI